MNLIENAQFKRITKGVARKLFNKGHDVYVLPCNVRLDSIWVSPTLIPKEYDFDKVINEYTYYNCNRELGTYCSYYISKSKEVTA